MIVTVILTVGVEVRPKTSVKAVSFDEDSKKVALTLDNGQTVSNSATCGCGFIACN